MIVGPDHVAPLKTKASLPLSTATHEVGEAHDTSNLQDFDVAFTSNAPCDHEDPSNMTTLPVLVTAAQKVALVQDTLDEMGKYPAAIWARPDQLVPSKVTTPP